MNIPDPKAGLVIRYAFLWSNDARRGDEEAAKERPATIVLAKSHSETGEVRVVVAPITHSEPANPDTSIEIPSDVCRSLGLDGERQWLIADEINVFVWPGFDLRPIPGSEDVLYGMLPEGLYEELRRKIARLNTERKMAVNNWD